MTPRRGTYPQAGRPPNVGRDVTLPETDGRERLKTVIWTPERRSDMDPVELIGDVIVALVSVAVVGILLWFVVSELLPGVL